MIELFGPINFLLIIYICTWIFRHAREINAFLTCKKFMQMDDLLFDFYNDNISEKELEKGFRYLKRGMTSKDFQYTFWCQIEHVERYNQHNELILLKKDRIVEIFHKWLECARFN